MSNLKTVFKKYKKIIGLALVFEKRVFFFFVELLLLYLLLTKFKKKKQQKILKNVKYHSKSFVFF